jgi:16S rRNA C967 or C1407 C5-methylase (RsmB/RsmF family)
LCPQKKKSDLPPKLRQTCFWCTEKMGKNKRHYKGANHSQDKKRRKDSAEKWASVRNDEQETPKDRGWNGEPFENKRFEAFYKAQHFLNDETDFSSFISTLLEPLPACFRINTDNVFANDLKDQLHAFVGKEITQTHNGKVMKSVEELSWYPNGAGYKLGTDRRSIRKSPELAELHEWMKLHTNNGNITRQEAVSMVPPVALAVEQHHKVLDMCAAPGSKTSQLLEVINRCATSSSSSSSTDASTSSSQGLVVANDVDTDRAYMLVHQCRRINSPFLVVTTHQGQSFPAIRDLSDTTTSLETLNTQNKPFFDRILCDVPCSGDGTMRKNPAIWYKWNTSMSAVMHPLQLMITQRAIQMLKDDGLIVYSTCSMSPYENEASVAELLRTNKGKLELIDARQFLPLFKARPGLTTWYVLDDHFLVRKENQYKREKFAAKQAAKAAKKNQKESDKTAISVETEAVKEEEETKAEDHQNEAEMDTDEAVDMNEEEQLDTEETDMNDVDLTKREEVQEEQKKDFSHITDIDLRHCLEMGMLHFPTFQDVPETVNWKFRQSLFPPTAEELEWMHLEKCLRCAPQDEDTGGFFVATLRKIPTADVSSSSSSSSSAALTSSDNLSAMISEEDEAKISEAIKTNFLPAGDERAEPQDQDVADTVETKKQQSEASTEISKNDQKQNARKGVNKDDNAGGIVKYYPWDQESFQKVKDFYGFDNSITVESFHTRDDISVKDKKSKDAAAKTIYYLPESVQSLLKGDLKKQLKIVTAGIKVFEKKVVPNAAPEYRLLQVRHLLLVKFIILYLTFPFFSCFCLFFSLISSFFSSGLY